MLLFRYELFTRITVPPLAHQVQHYLNETLGVTTSGNQAWAGQDGLPYFLRDAFELRQLNILGATVVLALDRHPEQGSLGDIRTWLAKIRSLAGHPTIYVTHALASYERKRLIEQKVPFIVPGNQLYLPDLGLDLREYFRQRPSSSEARLSPATQAMLITALLRPRWELEWHPAEVAALLGYTPMTLSRAVRELAAAGVAQVRRSGRSQYLAMTYSAQETWERASPLLRSPVQRTVWTSTRIERRPTVRLAGLSALAHHSILSEPRLAVFAVSRTDWKALKPNLEELHEAMPGAHEWQLWNYSPALEPDSGTVDPLSLILSLRENSDERIQSALEALKEQLPW
jgi:DNA-binding MarR family transcriptional regulator